MGDHGHNRHRLKRGGCCAPFTGAAGSQSNTMWAGLSSTSVPSGVFNPSSRLATIDIDWKLGGLPLLWGRRELWPHLTQWRLGRALPPYQVASWFIQPFGHKRHRPKIEWEAVPFFWDGVGSLLKAVAWAEAYLHTKWHLSPSSHLATTDIGWKLVGCAPLGEGQLGPHQTQCRLGWALPPYRLARINMGQKLAGCAPFVGSWVPI